MTFPVENPCAAAVVTLAVWVPKVRVPLGIEGVTRAAVTVMAAGVIVSSPARTVVPLGTAKVTDFVVSYPDRPGVFHGGRNFPTFEVARETLERERGQKIKLDLFKVVFVESDGDGREKEPDLPGGRETSEGGI